MRERERERERETICLGVFRAREAGLIQRRLLVKIGPTYLAHVSLGLESLPATYINARNNSEAPPHPYTYKMYIYIMCVCVRVCVYIFTYIYILVRHSRALGRGTRRDTGSEGTEGKEGKAERREVLLFSGAALVCNAAARYPPRASASAPARAEKAAKSSVTATFAVPAPALSTSIVTASAATAKNVAIRMGKAPDT